MNIIRPPALQTGDTIGVFTPSSPAHVHFRDKYLHGLDNLKRLGFQAVEGDLTASMEIEGYRAGSPRRRAEEFMGLIRRKDVKAMVATIGGSNSSSLLPYLNFDEIRANPKIICGYSDITSVHMAILAMSQLATFYGPAVMPSFGEWPTMLSETEESWLQAVQNTSKQPRELKPFSRWSNHFRNAKNDDWKTIKREYKQNNGWTVLNPGTVTAPIIIANLATLLCLAGTKYFPDLKNKILIIEEMDAPLDKEERNFRQLQLMGVFDEIVGLVVGKPEGLQEQGAPFNYDRLILETVGHQNYPIISNFDCSHTVPMMTLAQMLSTTIKADANGDLDITINEPMVVER